ncbi:4Fe-4S binding protein [Bacteroidota bacterium]
MKINIIFISLVILFNINFLQAQCGSCNSCVENQITSKNNKISVLDSEDEFPPLENESSLTDEFEEFSEFSDSEQNLIVDEDEKKNNHLFTVLWILLAVIITGILVRLKPSRHLRVVVMVGFLIYLGFYLGGCPCPISSFQELILAGLGVEVPWQNLVWFLALIPITYVFGKVWCGWVCHLGALQELLFLHNRFKFLSGIKTQKVMNIIRYLLIAALMVQLLITRTNWFCKIDPFKVAFNFVSAYEIGWYLLGLIILTSLFIYRPFCKAGCPIGLMLGLITKIPGASVLGSDDECKHCRLCSDTCKMDAIIRVDKNLRILDNKECIVCGDCMDSCRKGGLSFFRKGKKHNDKMFYKHENSYSPVHDSDSCVCKD